MTHLTRIPDARHGESIGRAMDIIPPRIRHRLGHVQFVCGVDPVFAGVHAYGSATDGRPYSATPHCVYPFHLTAPRTRQVTTVVLPRVAPLTTIVHELGHALHEAIGFDHDAAPTTAYARTDRWEAFAEAFTTWLFWGYGDEDTFGSDGATRALFEGLAA